MTLPRLDWDYVLARAARVVESYSTGVTLRQLFYRLVSAEIMENTQGRYNALSSRTAQARRDGWFPPLIDNVRTIRRAPSWDDPAEAMASLAAQYRRDRTIGQEVSIFIAVEKSALVGLLSSWYRDEGVGVLALGGYASQTYVDQIVRDVNRQMRPAVLIYAGDFDPSGLDIERDFVKRTDCWEEVRRIALTEEQIAEHDLPPLPGKPSDSRSAAFELKHGRLIQVELDALPPDTLQQLYREEFEAHWDPEAFERIREQEETERGLFVLPEGWEG